MLKRWHIFVLLAALVLSSVAATTLINLTTQVTGILPVANGGTGNSTGAEELLGCSSIGSNGTSVGPLTIPVRKLLMVHVYSPGFASSDSIAMQFNASGGTAYRYRWLVAAAGSTTWSAGGNVAVSQANIKIQSDNNTTPRNALIRITNDSGSTEKLVDMLSLGGTGSAATQTGLAQGNGAWISGASVSITQIGLSSTQNMLAGTGFCVYGTTF